MHNRIKIYKFGRSIIGFLKIRVVFKVNEHDGDGDGDGGGGDGDDNGVSCNGDGDREISSDV